MNGAAHSWPPSNSQVSRPMPAWRRRAASALNFSIVYQ